MQPTALRMLSKLVDRSWGSVLLNKVKFLSFFYQMLFSFTSRHCAMNAKICVKICLASCVTEAAPCPLRLCFYQAPVLQTVADSGVLAVSLTVLSDFILYRQSSSHLFFSRLRPSRKEKSNILEECTSRIGYKASLFYVPIIRTPSTRHSNASSSFSQILYMCIIMIYKCTQSYIKKK